MEEKKKFKLGLLPKLIIAIIVGILFGQFLPEGFCRFVVTLSSFFSQFLSFIIPLMILAYVTMGIANLKSGAGKLLLITVAIAYCSTLIAGSASFFVADTLFPHFMSADALDKIAATAGNSLEPYFSLEIPALMNTLSAVVTAFVLGLCMSSLRGKTIGDTLYNGVSDFSGIIDCVLHKVIIPLLPLYICGTFTDMTKSGKTFAILGILWKVFIVVIIMHLICICIQFVIAGLVSHKNPQPDSGLRNRTGHPVLCGYHSGKPPVCGERRRFLGNPQLYGSAVREHPHGRLDDHHYRLRYRSLPDEPAAHLHRHGHSLHHDPRHCHGRFSRCAGRLHYDRPALPVHDLRHRGRRPERPDLRHHGRTVHHAGLVRHRMQCFRRQRDRRDRGDHLPQVYLQILRSVRRIPYVLYQCF